MSLIYRMNRSGPKIDPLGSPQWIVLNLEHTFIFKEYIQPTEKDRVNTFSGELFYYLNKRFDILMALHLY